MQPEPVTSLERCRVKENKHAEEKEKNTMSSFVISKKEYIKAAGIVAGIAEAQRDFWLFDYEAQRNSTPEDYYNRFAECYTMNALSVQEQYGDDKPEADAEEYKREFAEYRAKGRSFVMNPEKYRNALKHLREFFSGAEYQTEKEAYFWKMQMYFNRILVALMKYAFPGEVESWGTLEH